MPFPLWVVSRTRETDVVRGRTTEVRYRYHNGHFDPLFRRFQGFANVERLEIGDASRADVLTRYRFLMNQASLPGNTREHAHLDRMLAEVSVFSLDGSANEQRPLRSEQTEYQVRELETLPAGTKRVFVAVGSTSKIFSERTSDERVETRSFDYDSFGNVVREVSRGTGIKGGARVPAQEVTTEVSYATDAG